MPGAALAAEPDLVVVGGGLLGCCVANEAVELGLRTVVLRLSDAQKPQADSLRNHKWLQSGLLYLDDPRARIVVRNAYPWGRRLLLYAGLLPPAERGVFRFANEAEAESFLVQARALHAARAERLLDHEAAELLGAFHVPDQPCFSVPDAPFPEGLLMEKLRDHAAVAGVAFVETEASLVRAGSDEGPGHLVVSYGGRRLCPRFTVLAAGAWTPALLDSLGLPHRLSVSRSPLMVWPTDAAAMRAPLVADRSLQFAVTQRGGDGQTAGTRLIFGDRQRAPVPADALTTSRYVLPRERYTLEGFVPPALRLARGDVRFTAGYKTEDGDSSVTPWIEEFEACPGLIAALPGKATMSLWATARVIERIRTSLGRMDTRGTEPNASGDVPLAADARARLDATGPAPHPRWEGPVHSHDEPYYDGVLDDSHSVE